MSGPGSAWCFVRQQLAQRFAIAARRYSEAVVQLTVDPVTMSPHDYQQLAVAVREALEQSQSAGRAYEEHVTSHGCQSTLN
jgi:hypothetical protein